MSTLRGDGESTGGGSSETTRGPDNAPAPHLPDESAGVTEAPWRFDLGRPLPPVTERSWGRRDEGSAEATVSGTGSSSAGGTQSPTPGPPSEPPHRRDPRMVVLAVATVVLVAAVGVLVAVLVAAEPEDSGQAARERQRPDRSAATRTPDRPAKSTSSTPRGDRPTAGDSVSTPPPATSATCWNGTRVESLSACSPPTGSAGVAYLFPQQSDQDCTLTPATQASRPLLYECNVILSDGTPVDVNYSEWTSTSPAAGYYNGLEVSGTFRRPGMSGWYITAGRGNPTYKAALLYDEVPFSVTVYADSDTGRQRALDELVLRPAAEVYGTVG